MDLYSSRREPINKTQCVRGCQLLYGKIKRERVWNFLLYIRFQKRMMFEQISKEKEGVSHFEQREEQKQMS